MITTVSLFALLNFFIRVDCFNFLLPLKDGKFGFEALRKSQLHMLSTLVDQAKFDSVLACPVGLSPLRIVELYTIGRPCGIATRRKFYESPEQRSKYIINKVYADLVGKEKPLNEVSFDELGKTWTFRNPLTAFLYERGWRQNFNNYGFKGIDAEFLDVQSFFSDLEDRQPVILDLSCGTGLMTRLLVASKRYSRVIGADFSEAMLYESARRFKSNKLPTPELVRLDVARMPFLTESVDGIHAGAALHCYPQLKESLSEIYRILKPGGKFYATTFLKADIAGQRNFGRTRTLFSLFELDELRSLMEDAGFSSSDVSVSRQGIGCGIIACTKQK